MLRLPVELIGLIISAAHLDDRRHQNFLAIRLVCHMFDCFAFPYVFKRIEFGGLSTSIQPIPSIQRLLRLARKRPEILASVRLMVFHVRSNVSPEDQGWLQHRLVLTLMRRVGRIGRLARLAIFVEHRCDPVEGCTLLPIFEPVAATVRALYLRGIRGLPPNALEPFINLRQLKTEEVTVTADSNLEPTFRPRLRAMTYACASRECAAMPIMRMVELSHLHSLSSHTTNSDAVLTLLVSAKDGWTSLRTATIDISALHGESPTICFGVGASKRVPRLHSSFGRQILVRTQSEGHHSLSIFRHRRSTQRAFQKGSKALQFP
jgi:hypothetical protein